MLEYLVLELSLNSVRTSVRHMLDVTALCRIFIKAGNSSKVGEFNSSLIRISEAFSFVDFDINKRLGSVLVRRCSLLVFAAFKYFYTL